MLLPIAARGCCCLDMKLAAAAAADFRSLRRSGVQQQRTLGVSATAAAAADSATAADSRSLRRSGVQQQQTPGVSAAAAAPLLCCSAAAAARRSAAPLLLLHAPLLLRCRSAAPLLILTKRQQHLGACRKCAARYLNFRPASGRGERRKTLREA